QRSDLGIVRVLAHERRQVLARIREQYVLDERKRGSRSLDVGQYRTDHGATICRSRCGRATCTPASASIGDLARRRNPVASRPAGTQAHPVAGGEREHALAAAHFAEVELRGAITEPERAAEVFRSIELTAL